MPRRNVDRNLGYKVSLLSGPLAPQEVEKLEQLLGYIPQGVDKHNLYFSRHHISLIDDEVNRKLSFPSK